MIFKEQEVLSFDDVLLVPQYSSLESRSNIDTSITINKNNKSKLYKIPIISSPMSTNNWGLR